jgi:hypothetical protein
VLDGKEVATINAHFEDSVEEGDPVELAANDAKVFQGSIFLGDGFLLKHEEAARLVHSDPRNAEVIFPVINGQELNNRPDQKPGRSIINFHDWSLERAAAYQEPFEIVERLVRPKRLANARVATLPWWLYERARVEIYRTIAPLARCFVAAATTKYLNFSAVQTNYVFTHALFVFTTDRWDLYAVVQSTQHEVWARKYSGSLKQDLRYSPSDCFETFAFPEGIWRTANPGLADIGERYHEHRKSLMLSLWLGLTDTYNLFHARDLSPAKVASVSKKPEDEAEFGYEGLLELRRLRRELDLAVRDAYGWQDLDLGHDFHEVETLAEKDRVRYTISSAARKEVLKRLLVLNHARAEATAVAKHPKRKRGRKVATDENESRDLFSQETSS